MFDLSIFSYRLPSLGGLYNKEECSLHLIEAMNQILKYPNMYYCISAIPFSASKQKNLVRLQSQLFEVLLCRVEILSFYVYCYCV